MSKTVVGLYSDIQHARMALDDLVRSGFRREDISLIASDEKGNFKKYLSKEGKTGKGEDVADGAAAGAGIGAALGGLGGILVGLGLLTIPGVGPFLAAGPIAAGLAGAGLGAVSGGIVGALVDLGIPDDKAKVYEQSIRRGAVMVAVNTPDNMARKAADILNAHDPIDADAPMESRSRTTTLRDDRSPRDIRKGEGDVTLPVMEEELRVGKREVEEGGVRVNKTVDEKPVEETVHLREEHVNVDRRPVDRPVDPSDLDAFEEGTIEMTERHEEAVVDKRARVVEEVNVSKDVEEHPETIRDTVRRTDVEVENLSGKGTRHDSFDDNYFRDHFNQSYGNTSYTYDQYRPYYQYGYGLHSNSRYANRSSWNEVEQDARRDWERQHPDRPWDQVKDAVRQGWEAMTGHNI